VIRKFPPVSSCAAMAIVVAGTKISRRRISALHNVLFVSNTLSQIRRARKANLSGRHGEPRWLPEGWSGRLDPNANRAILSR